MTRATLAIAAGGTGGHLVPALAIAASIRRLRPDARIVFIGGRRGMETAMVPAAGYELFTTGVKPFARSPRGALAPLSLLPATPAARRILRRTGARAVLGMGGYPSIPAVLAARTRGIPVLVHEQNAVPGLANEIGARVTRNVAVSFPATVRMLRHARLVGMPVRAEIETLNRDALRAEALDGFELAADRRTVLVFGGSLGAARVNAAAVALAERWRDRDDVQLLLGTGATHHDAVARRLPGGKLRMRAVPYLERMDHAYAAADMVVCRAGASTVHELALAGLPSILIPFPAARRREQHENARLLTDADAALAIEDAQLDGEALDGMLASLLADEDRRVQMGAAARAAALPGAAEEMAGWVVRLMEGAHA